MPNCQIPFIPEPCKGKQQWQQRRQGPTKKTALQKAPAPKDNPKGFDQKCCENDKRQREDAGMLLKQGAKKSFRMAAVIANMNGEPKCWQAINSGGKKGGCFIWKEYPLIWSVQQKAAGS